MAQASSRSVLVIGAGAAGSAALLYIAAAGPARIGIVDDRVVAEDDEPGAVLQFAPDAGVNRAESAAAKLRFLAPDVLVETYPVTFDSLNADAVIAGQDVVLDAGGDPGTSLLASDAAKAAGCGLVSVARDGERAAIVAVPAGAAGCVRCLYDGPPPFGARGPATAAGAAGVLAARAVLALAGGELRAHVLMLDLAAPSLSRLTLAADPGCPACSGSTL